MCTQLLSNATVALESNFKKYLYENRPSIATAGIATANIATAGIATAGIATAGIATAGIATAGIATAGIATIQALCNHAGFFIIVPFTLSGEPRDTPTHVCDLLVHVPLHHPPLLGHSADHL